MIRTIRRRAQRTRAALVLLLLLAAWPGAATQAQAGSRLFPETGKTVKGKFLTYWTAKKRK